MKMIEEQFLLFTKSNTLEEGLQQLQEYLKKSNQINNYDLIYNQYIDNNPVSSKLHLMTLIPGLNQSIYLMIFTCYYRYLLKKNLKRSQHFEKILQALLNDQYIMYDKISIIYHQLYFDFILSIIPSEEEEDEEEDEENIIEYENFKDKLEDGTVTFDFIGTFNIYDSYEHNYQTNCNNKIFLKYIIVGDSLFTIDNIVDGLFYDNRIIKLLITAKFYYTEREKNVDTRRFLDFSIPKEFFIHDLNHTITVQEDMIKNQQYLDDYRNFYLQNRKYVRSFKHRYASFILFLKFFESKYGVLENIDQYLNNIILYSIDISSYEDVKEYFSGLKYVCRAPDFNVNLYDTIISIDGLNYDNYDSWDENFKKVFDMITKEFLQ